MKSLKDSASTPKIHTKLNTNSPLIQIRRMKPINVPTLIIIIIMRTLNSVDTKMPITIINYIYLKIMSLRLKSPSSNATLHKLMLVRLILWTWIALLLTNTQWLFTTMISLSNLCKTTLSNLSITTMFNNIMPNKNKIINNRAYKKSINYINNVGNLRKQLKYSRGNVE